MKPFTMRGLYAIAAASSFCLSAQAVSAQTAPDLSGQTFVFGGFGGDFQKYQDQAWLQPFAAATGVKIDQTDSPDMATLKTQQEAANVGLDVFEIESATVDANCGTVFQTVTIDRSQLNPALDTNACGVPVVKFSYVLAYNSAKYPVAPTSVADLFDTEKFPGMRGIRAGANSGLIEAALLADGVAPVAIYPIDVDRAVTRIETIRDSLDPKESFAVLQEGLANGEFDMAMLPNGRALNASKSNPDIKVVFVGAVTLYDNLAIPTGAKNVEAATAFLQFVALNSTQNALAELFPYGTGTIGEPPMLDDVARGFFPDTFADQLLLQDAEWWGANEAAVNDRLTTVFAQ